MRYQSEEIVNARFTARERRPLNDNSIKKGRLAEAAARPCTHKSRLVSSGWSMSTLPPKRTFVSALSMSDSAGDVLTLANEVFDADDKDKIGTNSVCFRTSIGAKSGHRALWRLRRTTQFSTLAGSVSRLLSAKRIATGHVS